MFVSGCHQHSQNQQYSQAPPCRAASIGYVVEEKWSPYDKCVTVIPPVVIMQQTLTKKVYKRSKRYRNPPSSNPRSYSESSAAKAGTGGAAVQNDKEVVRTGGGQGAYASDGKTSSTADARSLL